MVKGLKKKVVLHFNCGRALIKRSFYRKSAKAGIPGYFGRD